MPIKWSCLMILILLSGCKSENNNPKEAITPKKSNPSEQFFLTGDINNDGVSDTARVTPVGNFRKRIVFSNAVPDIEIESPGIVVQPTEDLTGDNANEIIVFSRTHEGWWNTITVYSYNNQRWTALATSKGFISQDRDFENRILKENDTYYLIGDDQWNEDSDGTFLKTRIKI